MSSIHQIAWWMRHYTNNFLGVYARDEMPCIYKCPSSVIINTESRQLAGKHWVAVLYDNEAMACYFDPMGGIPLPDIFSRIYAPDIWYTLKRSQQSNITCGEHCCFFLYNKFPASSDYECILYINKNLN